MKIFTHKEVSTLLKITLPTLQEWTKLGLLPSYPVSFRRLYKSNEVDQAILAGKYKKY